MRASSAQDLYDHGEYMGPAEPVGAAMTFLEVALYDPHALLEHHQLAEEFYDLPSSAVHLTLLNQLTGAMLEIHELELVPTYSQKYGLHYGANVTLPHRGTGTPPGGGGAPPQDEGGHDHG